MILCLKDTALTRTDGKTSPVRPCENLQPEHNSLHAYSADFYPARKPFHFHVSVIYQTMGGINLYAKSTRAAPGWLCECSSLEDAGFRPVQIP